LTLKRIGIVTGLKSEAGCLKSEDVVCAGADSARAYNLAKQLADNGCLSLMSFGIAGGLAPHLNPGNIVIGEKVVGSENDEIECDFAGRQKLLEILQDAHSAPVFSSNKIIDLISEKEAIFKRYGTAVADMESMAVGRAASELNLPFHIVRVVADPASQRIPGFALKAIDEFGNTHIGPVIRGLISSPREIGNLIRLSRNSNTAFKVLRRVALLIGSENGL